MREQENLFSFKSAVNYYDSLKMVEGKNPSIIEVEVTKRVLMGLGSKASSHE